MSVCVLFPGVGAFALCNLKLSSYQHGTAVGVGPEGLPDSNNSRHAGSKHTRSRCFRPVGSRQVGNLHCATRAGVPLSDATWSATRGVSGIDW